LEGLEPSVKICLPLICCQLSCAVTVAGASMLSPMAKTVATGMRRQAFLPRARLGLLNSMSTPFLII
jgi:hypothetical protein